jgi:hypothetical protein
VGLFAAFFVGFKQADEFDDDNGDEAEDHECQAETDEDILEFAGGHELDGMEEQTDGTQDHGGGDNSDR